MDDPSGKGIAPEAVDERSAVLSMLTSEAWQKRLQEAREAREKVLASRSAKSGAKGTPKSPKRRKDMSGALVSGDTPFPGIGMPIPPAPDASAEEDEEFPEFFIETEDELREATRPRRPVRIPPRPRERKLSILPPLEPAGEPYPVVEGESSSLVQAIVPEQAELPLILPAARAATLAPASPLAQHDWRHIPPVGPARQAEPVQAPAAQTAPVARRRPLRTVAGFLGGLALGAVAASVIWTFGLFGPPATLAVPQPAAAPAPAVAAPEPAVTAPAPLAIPVQVVAAPAEPAPPPVAASVLPGPQGLPEVPPDGADAIVFHDITNLSGSLLPPLSAAPAAGDLPQGLPGTPGMHPSAILSLAPPGPPQLAEDAAARLPGAIRPFVWPAAAVILPPVSPDMAMAAVQPPPAAPAPPAPAAEPSEPAEPPPVVEAALVPEPAPEPEPEQAAAPAAPALAPHVAVLMVPSTYADSDVTRTIAELKTAGFTLADPTRVPFKIKADHVRFYHPGDRPAAEALARAIGGEARDFTSSGSRPAEGRIEVFLEGGAAPPAKAKPAKKARQQQSAPAAPQEPQEDPRIRALRDKIVRQLQQGDHL